MTKSALHLYGPNPKPTKPNTHSVQRISTCSTVELSRGPLAKPQVEMKLDRLAFSSWRPIEGKN